MSARWPDALQRTIRERDAAIGERDRARDVAVALEQEVAVLRKALVNAVEALREDDDDSFSRIVQAVILENALDFASGEDAA